MRLVFGEERNFLIEEYLTVWQINFIIFCSLPPELILPTSFILLSLQTAGLLALVSTTLVSAPEVDLLFDL